MSEATMVIRRPSDDTVVCESCAVANRSLTRMKGLLGRRDLAPEEGMLIEGGGVSAIHTFFMRFAIDLVFLDRDATVLRVAARVRPWRVRRCRNAVCVLELIAGEAARRRIACGQQLSLEPRPA